MSDIKITISEKGSYKVEGTITLLDFEGNEVETVEGKPFFLCRCGASANKPFCDGSHKTCDFDGRLASHTSQLPDAEP